MNIPKQYKPLVDDAVLNIRDEVKRIIPIIDELGDSFNMDIDSHTVEIKRRNTKETECKNGQIERVVIQQLFIRVEFDSHNGWVVEIPQIYSDGIEYETEGIFDTKKDATKSAKEIHEKIRLPILINNKRNSYYKIISKVV